ncbi:MAG: hypothetical protein RI957_1195 [Verrucomicrobiota bacterium]|jgi:hypothetical protein
MKKHGTTARIRKGGILHWSTLCLLAGSGMGLSSCDSQSSYTATAADEQMAGLQKKLDEIESRRSQLTQGYLEHNLEWPGLGFYHADANDFFPYKYGEQQNGKWYANGQWQDSEPSAPTLTSSRPSVEALKKVEMLLDREQQLASQSGSSGSSTVHHHHGGGGIGNMLMMYWLLSGNRGSYTPGGAFQRAQTNQSTWQQTLNQDRQRVTSYAASNPGYQRLVQESRSSGAPVTAGKSVRGGFGSSSSGRTSFGS